MSGGGERGWRGGREGAATSFVPIVDRPTFFRIPRNFENDGLAESSETRGGGKADSLSSIARAEAELAASEAAFALDGRVVGITERGKPVFPSCWFCGQCSTGSRFSQLLVLWTVQYGQSAGRDVPFFLRICPNNLLRSPENQCCLPNMPKERHVFCVNTRMIPVPQSRLIIAFVEKGAQVCMMVIGGRWLERRLPDVVSDVGQLGVEGRPVEMHDTQGCCADVYFFRRPT